MAVEPCKHGDIRPHNCALCRHERFGDRDYRYPHRGETRMPPWFRAMLEEFRGTGVMSVPPEILAHDRRYRGADDDRARY
jgi:hypothetical protein